MPDALIRVVGDNNGASGRNCNLVRAVKAGCRSCAIGVCIIAAARERRHNAKRCHEPHALGSIVSHDNYIARRDHSYPVDALETCSGTQAVSKCGETAACERGDDAERRYEPNATVTQVADNNNAARLYHSYSLWPGEARSRACAVSKGPGSAARKCSNDAK